MQLDVAHRGAGQHLGRRLDPEHLLDRGRDQRRVGHELGPLLGVASEQLGAEPDQGRGRVVAGDQEQEGEAEQLLVGQVLAVDLGRDAARS